MKRFILILVAFFSMAPAILWAGSNPARQYEQQRNTESPADGVWHVYDKNGNFISSNSKDSTGQSVDQSALRKYLFI